MAECENSAALGQASNSHSEPPKLSDLLDRGWKIFDEVDSTNEPLGSNSVQVKVKRGISSLEEASRMAAQLHLFSRNEELEEVSTADLKYLMLPALLGALTMKQTSRDKRLDIVQTARAYFMDFLVRCKEYNVAKIELPKGASENTNGSEDASENGPSASRGGPCQSDLVAMAAQRQAKIERYRQKKELETRLSEVRRIVDSGQADEEVSRDFYLLNIRRWVGVSLEEVESIDQEVEILKRMDLSKHIAPRQPPQPARPPMKPFILTKDAAQARVFGAGYPSLPTMTVDDWYEQHRKHGALPDQGIPSKVTVGDDETEAKEREEEEKEKKVEQDDEESLQKARNWDDWKDTHRRGYGNRKNMG